MADKRVWVPLADGVIQQTNDVVTSLSENGTLFSMSDGKETVTLRFKGDDYRLCRATTVPAVGHAPSAEVAETIRLILRFAKYNPNGDRSHIVERIDNALAWLDQQKGTGDATP